VADTEAAAMEAEEEAHRMEAAEEAHGTAVRVGMAVGQGTGMAVAGMDTAAGTGTVGDGRTMPLGAITGAGVTRTTMTGTMAVTTLMTPATMALTPTFTAGMGAI
jgi:hypothetical protein